MGKEVFLSYSRRDEALCNQIYELIHGRLGYEVFVDRHIPGGTPWKEMLTATLKDEAKPDLVLLATQSAADKPEWIRKELNLAKRSKLKIIPLEFSPGTAKSILKTDKYQWQTFSRSGPTLDEFTLNKLERWLRVALHRKVSLELESFREHAKQWASSLIPPDRVNFWSKDWQSYILPKTNKSVVLTAAGGGGKSVIIAHFVRYLLEEHPKNFPIVIDEPLLELGVSYIAKLLGTRLPEELHEHLEQMQLYYGERVVFIIDGLDQMAIPNDPGQKKIIETINQLSSSARIIIGCRKVNWDTTYAFRLSLAEQPVEALSDSLVYTLISAHAKHLLKKVDTKLLKTPLFLDLTLRNAHYWNEVPETQTGFLQKLWTDILRAQRIGPADEQNAVNTILTTLAGLQLEAMNYEVSFDELKNCSGLAQHFEHALHQLENEKLLQKKSTRYGRSVRFVHDLLDDFGMVRLLLNDVNRRQELYRRFEKDCGRSVLASLVLAAHDQKRHEIVQEIFRAILFVLDRKPLKDDLIMARGWAVTDVLKIRFRELLPYILKCLDGEKVEGMPSRDSVDTLSSLDPPRITQATASTLASAWLGITRGEIPDAPQVIPVLAKGLYKWTLRARFIEGLAKYDHPEALAAIVAFGYQELEKTKTPDHDVLKYVAKVLRNYNSPDSTSLLQKIITAEYLKPVTRRIAKESLNQLRSIDTPEQREEEEIIEGLKPYELNGRYSDWREVQEYAEYVRKAILNGQPFSHAVVKALIEALQHNQTDVRRPVAECLSLFDAPEARDALLGELLEAVVPLNVRKACINGLKEQLNRCATSAARQNHRILLLRAALEAEAAGSIITAGELVALATDHKTYQSGDWLIDEHAAEVIEPLDKQARIIIKRVPETNAPVEPSIVACLKETDFEAAGPTLETKYRFTALQTQANGDLHVEFTETTWTLGKSFHNVLRCEPQRFSAKRIGVWFTPIPLGTVQLPGIAVVHVIVLTSDRKILLAKRSETTGYAPLHWSASFEEQITNKDFSHDSDSVAVAATCRGFREEFGLEISPTLARSLSVFLEIDTLNLGIAMLLQPGLTFDEIRKRWLTKRHSTHYSEVAALESLEASLDAIEAVIAGTAGPTPLHPTSVIRLAMLERLMRHNEKL